MSTARKAREWLAAQDGPRTSRQIADAIGGNPINVQWAVGVMLRDGLMNRVSAKKPCTYVVAREGKTPVECAAIALEARRNRSAVRAVEREAERVARADVRRVERNRVSAQRRREREIARKAADRARYEAKRATTARKLEMQSVSKSEPKALVIRAQTVEEFMAMGGHVERLETNFRPRGVSQ